MNWYTLKNESQVDSPSLLVYKDRVASNIDKLIAMAGGANGLYVHVKTNKTLEIVQMMLKKGIKRFKCATIAEAEMVCMAGGKTIVIAHQLVGPKINRLVLLCQKYPDVQIASLVDNPKTAQDMNTQFKKAKLTATVFIDINNGMDRSGLQIYGEKRLEKALDFYTYLHSLTHLKCLGLHVYDGHLRDTQISLRQSRSDTAFEPIAAFLKAVEAKNLPKPMLILGGTPTSTTHFGKIDKVSTFCSPGTFVLWDYGYGDTLLEQTYDHAALVLCRIISKPTEGIVTIDLGHKGIASENPIDKRIRFLNITDYTLLSQSEEHGVLSVKDWDKYKIGDALYGVPYHICPTVNLYEEMQVVENQSVKKTWQIIARKRKISI